MKVTEARLYIHQGNIPYTRMMTVIVTLNNRQEVKLSRDLPDCDFHDQFSKMWDFMGTEIKRHVQKELG